MSTITPHYRSIKALLQSQSFSIDEYQREYKWEKKHVDDLLSDLYGKFEKSYEAGDDTKAVSEYDEYFLGSIIVSKRENKSYIVDGQQRITTLTLLLIYLYHAAGKRSNSNLQGVIVPLIYSDNYGEKSFNLDIPERLPVIKALFNGKEFTPDGTDESVRTIYERYGDIESRDMAGELGEALPHFVYWLINNVGLIEIVATSNAHANAIFETMNDRGKPLSPVDMLKAYLLAPIEDPNARREANKVWRHHAYDLITWGEEHDRERDAECIKAWFRAQHAKTIRKRKKDARDQDWELIGSTFHRWARNQSERLGLASAEQNVAMMTERFPFFARAYQYILDASVNYTDGLESIFFNAHNGFTWQNTVLLAPLCTTDNQDIVRRKMQAMATYLDIWVMRRVVNYTSVNYSNTSYRMFLLCNDVRRKPLPELVSTLKKKLDQDAFGFDGNAEKGRAGIRALSINHFSRRYIYHLLARLTAHLDAKEGNADHFDHYVDRDRENPLDIEHIWPDRYDRFSHAFDSKQEFAEARDHVGGLVLLPADVNRSLQQKPFEAKAPVYAKQNAFAGSLAPGYYDHQPRLKRYREQNNLPLKSYDHFGVQGQEERAELIERLAEEVWSPTRLDGVLE